MPQQNDAHPGAIAEPESEVQTLTRAIEALRKELGTVRRTQLQLSRGMLSLRHELGHRLGGTREELGALIKAAHADLVERIDALDALVDDQRHRLEDLERDLDDLVE